MNMRMRMVPILCSAVFSAGSAFAAPLAISEADLAPYRAKVDDQGNPAEPLAAAGDRFMSALKERDPAVWAAVKDSARTSVEEEVTQKVTRDQSFVMTAYGIIWALLAIFAAGVWYKSRQLTSRLGDVEARLARAERD